MELFETQGSIEDRLVQRAEKLRIPIGGTIELLPLCNMNCSMCYIQDNAQSIRNQLLGVKTWMEIASKLKAEGTLFLLITGGEPLLHPDFRMIYTQLMDMGFVITLNTNGTLIDEDWADFFAEHPCRRINISLYGASNETYAKLCHNSKGYDQAIRALHLLKERNTPVRVSISLVKENRDDLNEIVSVVNRLGMPYTAAAYMFPPTRRGHGREIFDKSRMAPHEAAQTRIQAILLKSPNVDAKEQAKALISKITGPMITLEKKKGFSCRAGTCGFWVNWRGEMRPCGMMNEPGASILAKPIDEVWKEMVEDCSSIITCQACKTCRKKSFCQTCAAACLTETGEFDGRPQYLCDVTDEMIKILLNFLDEGDRNAYAEKIKKVFPDLL